MAPIYLARGVSVWGFCEDSSESWGFIRGEEFPQMFEQLATTDRGGGGAVRAIGFTTPAQAVVMILLWKVRVLCPALHTQYSEFVNVPLTTLKSEVRD
jgi:hypothetical protein